MSTYRNAFPILYTHDLPASLEFYRDRLGFAETYRFPPEGGRPEFVSLRLADGAGLALADLRAGGVPVLAEPADQPLDERVAYVADPGGRPVMIFARR